MSLVITWGFILSTPAAINGKEIFELLHDDLLAIESEFGRDTVSDVSAITEIGEYLRGRRRESGSVRRCCCLSAKLFDYAGGARCDWARWSRSSTQPRWCMTTLLMRRRRDAGVRRPTRAGEIRSACWPATGSTCRRSRSRCRSAIFAILDTLIELTQQMVEGELLQMEKLGKLISLRGAF